MRGDIFGLKTPQCKKDKIKNILSMSPNIKGHLKLYEMQRSNDEYALIKQEVDF